MDSEDEGRGASQTEAHGVATNSPEYDGSSNEQLDSLVLAIQLASTTFSSSR